MSATPLYVESDIKSGQTLAGSSFDNTYLFVASGGEILNDQLHGGARGYIEQGGTAVDIGVYSAAFISGGGNTLLSHDTIHAGGVQYLQTLIPRQIRP